MEERLALMTEQEVKESFLQAGVGGYYKQIIVISELNCCSKDHVKKVLANMGVDTATLMKKRKDGRRRKG